MGKCQKIRRKHRKICIGDLDTLISIKSRNTVTKNFLPDVGFAVVSQPWALWETVRGEEVFDDSDTGEQVTDIAIIRYDASITKEFFVELEGENYRILDVEDLERRHEWTKLSLTNRGITSKEVNYA